MLQGTSIMRNKTDEGMQAFVTIRFTWRHSAAIAHDLLAMKTTKIDETRS